MLTFLARRLMPYLLALPLLAHAAWPEKPIRFIVPYTPGGATDIVARLLAGAVGPAIGTSIVVENRGGASGNIGMDLAARAAADGYTIVMVSAGQTIAASYFKKLTYNLRKDFVPIAFAVRNQRILVGRLGLPYQNVAELIAFAKNSPGKVLYASFGQGSSGHLAGQLFSQAAGIQLVDVPYKGNADAVNDLLGGRVDIMFSEMSSAVQHVRAGKLKGFGVASEERFAGLPNIPTVAEEGLPGFEASGWLGVMAPAGTPMSIVRTLNAEIVKAIAQPTMKARFAEMGSESIATTPESFGEFIEKDLIKWERVVRTAGISAD